MPSPACPVAVAANATHSCFPFRLCNPGIADVNTSVWHACKFAAHFREACQEYLVFDYLVHAVRNRTAHPWLLGDGADTACAMAFSPDELAIPSCPVLRALYLCDSTRAALNASGLLGARQPHARARPCRTLYCRTPPGRRVFSLSCSLCFSRIFWSTSGTCAAQAAELRFAERRACLKLKTQHKNHKTTPVCFTLSHELVHHHATTKPRRPLA